MELTLNLGWALIALWMSLAWVRNAPHAAPLRRIQMVALALVIAILLPAISMTDDLVAAQNPAEIDCCARRVHDQVRRAHSIVPIVAPPPHPGIAEVLPAFAGPAPVNRQPSPFVANLCFTSIENRPPPAA